MKRAGKGMKTQKERETKEPKGLEEKGKPEPKRDKAEREREKNMKDRSFKEEDLKALGIRFSTEQESQLFLETLNEDLELRIDGAMRELDAKFFDYVNQCKSRETMLSILEERYPDYEAIVLSLRRDIKKEIRKHREQIPGLVS